MEEQYFDDEDIDSVLDELAVHKIREKVSKKHKKPEILEPEPERPKNLQTVQVVAKISAQTRTDAATKLLDSAISGIESVGQEILDSWRNNTAEIQEVINYCKESIMGENPIINPRTGMPPPILIESLVKSIEVKSNMAMTAVKVLEAKTKLLSATKSSIGTLNQQNNIAVNGGELEAILSRPMVDDFDEA